MLGHAKKPVKGPNGRIFSGPLAILPKYKGIKLEPGSVEKVPGEFSVSMGPNGVKTARLVKTRSGGMDVYLAVRASREVQPAQGRPDVGGQAGGVFQLSYGLNPDPDAPLFAAISRISWQKGLDLVAAIIPDLLASGAQVALIGSAHPEDAEGMEVELQLREWARSYPGQVFFHPFDLDVPPILYAVSDFFLMPSRFEPCGLTQQIAMLYGSIPVATRVGGLVGTVEDDDRRPEARTGILFAKAAVMDLLHGVQRALGLYRAGGMPAADLWTHE